MSENQIEGELESSVDQSAELSESTCSDGGQCSPWRKFVRRAMLVVLFVLVPLSMWNSGAATEYWTAAASQGTLFPRDAVETGTYDTGASCGSCCSSKTEAVAACGPEESCPETTVVESEEETSTTVGEFLASENPELDNEITE